MVRIGPIRLGASVTPEFQAYAEYAAHQRQCRPCRTTSPCPHGFRLHNAWKAAEGREQAELAALQATRRNGRPRRVNAA